MTQDLNIIIPKSVSFILNRLTKKGYEAYIVGGAIRDSFLKRNITDWDIATSASSSKIREIFSDITLFSLKHETITLVIDGKNYEITPFKGRNIWTDLLYRDFTINAIAYDPYKEQIIDPVNGLKDLNRRIIKATVEPRERFLEDPLRILRTVRFFVELDFRIENKTLNVAKDMADYITKISKERIRDELVKILLSPNPSKGIQLIYRLGLLKNIIPELIEGYKVRQNSYHKHTVFKHILITLENVEPNLILRLSALFHDIAKPRVKKKIKGKITFYGHDKESANIAKYIMKRLRFSNEVINQVYLLVKEHMIDYSPKWSNAAIRRLINMVGKDLIFSLISLRKADIIAHGNNSLLKQLSMLEELKIRVEHEINKGNVFSVKDLKIDGFIIMKELNLSQGPEVGKILKALYHKVIEDPALNEPSKLIYIAKQIKKQI